MTPITPSETLGKVLRQYRKVQGLTQSEASRKLNIPQKTVSNIESGITGVQLATLFTLMSALRLFMAV